MQGVPQQTIKKGTGRVGEKPSHFSYLLLTKRGGTQIKSGLLRAVLDFIEFANHRSSSIK